MCYTFIPSDSIMTDALNINREQEALRSFDEPTSKNQVVIFGQTLGDFCLFNPIEESRPIEKRSLQKLDIDYFTVVNLDGHIYVLGENQSVFRLNHLDVGATWDEMASMNKPHGRCPPAAVMEGHIYVIGGHDLSTNAAEYYNPQVKGWELLQEAPKATQCAGILASGNCIYTFGGMVDHTFVNDVTRLDVKTSQWQELCPMNEKKGFVAAAECGDFLYVAGGSGGSARGYLKTFERYSPSTDQWTFLADMEISRGWFNLHVVGKHIYALGGFYTSPKIIEKYDIENDTWATLKNKFPFKIADSVLI